MKNKTLLLLGLVAGAASAQGNVFEEIVVTAAKRSYDYYDMPAVTMNRQADFLVQNIRLINDSRSPDLRKSEIIPYMLELSNCSSS